MLAFARDQVCPAIDGFFSKNIEFNGAANGINSVFSLYGEAAFGQDCRDVIL